MWDERNVTEPLHTWQHWTRKTPAAGALEHTQQYWYMVHGFPFPRDERKCPYCEECSLIIKRWHYHKKALSENPYRCDVNMKCCECAAVWIHGISIERDDWMLRRKPGQYTRHAAVTAIEKELANV
jgi:hypothetical protein